jgi:hypothetical protein
MNSKIVILLVLLLIGSTIYGNEKITNSNNHQFVTNSECSLSGSLTNGLAAYYPFCGNANDESGNGLNGTVNRATLTTDRFGNQNSAYSFTRNQDIIIPNTQTQNLFPMSISLWYKIDSINKGDESNIFSKYFSAEWNGYLIQVIGSADDGNIVYPYFIRNITNKVLGLYGEESFHQPQVEINKWYHFVYIIDEDGGKIYVNGELISTHSWTGEPGSSSNSDLWKIGGFYNHWFHGKIDDIGIWNRVLTEDEINQLYTNCFNTTEIEPLIFKQNTGGNIKFSASSTNEDAIFQWQTNPSSIGWQNIVDNQMYLGSKNNELNISNVQISNHLQPIRVIATSGTCIDTSKIASINITDLCKNSISNEIFNLNWVKGIGNTLNEQFIRTDNDSQGNIYIAGYFVGTVDFDPGAGVQNLTSQNTTIGDTFILKLDANGNFVWVKKINLNNNSLSQEALNRIKISKDGIYITGAFQGTTDFDPNIGVYNLTCNGSRWDAFLLKLDFNGNFMWAKSFGSSLNDCGRNIAFDSSDNIYLIGYFEGTVDFNFGATSYNLTSNGLADGFILKLAPNGNFVWVKKFGGTGEDDFYGIQIDNQDNIYYSGTFESLVCDIDPGTTTCNLNNQGKGDFAIGKLDSNGMFIWGKQIGNSDPNWIYVLKYNRLTNQIIIAGNYSSALDIDPGANSNIIISNGGEDFFISALDSHGELVWFKSIGGLENDNVYDCVIDENGRIGIVGTFNNIVDFDPSTSVYNLSSYGLKDIFFTLLTSSGDFINAINIGNSNNENSSLTGILACPSSAFYLTGFFSNTVDFDPSFGIVNMTSNGLDDIFCLKLNANLCNCDTFNQINVYDTITTLTSVVDTLIITINLSGVSSPFTNKIMVYPNPTKDYITVNYGNLALMNGCKLNINNSMGQVVYTTSITEQYSTINLSNLGGIGMYFVNILDKLNNLIESKKLILKE